MNKPTACIISRVMTIDLPWYSQWLEHHERLGFTHFHLNYCDDVHLPADKVLAYFPEDKVTVANLPKRLAEIDLIRDIPRTFEADYVLYIDSDEFLILPEGEDVGSFLGRHPDAEQFRFRWRMCVSDKPVSRSLAEQADTTAAYGVGQHKSMTRKDLLAGVGDTHDPILRRPLSSPPHEEEGTFLLHFASRGLIDPYLKAREQGLANNHAGDLEKLKRLMDPAADKIDLGMIPKRILAALGEIQCGNPRETISLTPPPSSGTEFGLLGRMVSAMEREIFSRRWEDLKRADLFRGLTIKSQPKFEIWQFLSGQEGRIISLTPR
jgi:hypothetical protein